MAKQPKKDQIHKKSVNFWQMMRDVLIAALSKGQFPLAIVGFIIIIIILKMPSEDVTKLAFALIDKIGHLDIVGFLLSFILLLAWFLHVKLQRRIFHKEIERISEERNFYQTQLLGKNISTSRR